MLSHHRRQNQSVGSRRGISQTDPTRMKRFDSIPNLVAGWAATVAFAVVALPLSAQVTRESPLSSARASQFADSILRLMTLDEKLGQLNQLPGGGQQISANDRQALRAGRVGSFLNVFGADFTRELQRIAVTESRLKIPLLFAHDVIHGFRTIYPVPLAEAASFDSARVEFSARQAAIEATAHGLMWTFAPMVDLARDPRWGRIAEGFGEDPWLGARYAAACVRGFQGAPPGGLVDSNHEVACLKHYVGYGAAEGGRDYNTTEISEYTLRNFYLPQFKAGVDAGAGTLMSAFNCLSGIPASANHHTLTEILRGEWKFSGFVVSDWTAVEELMAHGVAANGAEAARLALTAGVDMEMVSSNYNNTLARQLKSGKIPAATIEE